MAAGCGRIWCRAAWEWIDAQHLALREREITADDDRVVTREIVLHTRDGIIADQYYGQRLYTRDRICALLRDAGFGPIEFHSNLTLDGQDGRDPGQMQNRLLLTASPRAEKSGREAAPAVSKAVVMVLLGDPGLPDKVKNGGRFNPEDTDAVMRLRTALSAVDGYSFYYVENHQGLIDQLRSDQPALVFNLCDEGFNNDPEMELHIPALLEMLAIKYTGAPPSCLATCYDKSLVRALALSMNIPVPDEILLPGGAPPRRLPPFPLFVKPARADGSFGIRPQSYVENETELRDALKWLEELNAGPCLMRGVPAGRGIFARDDRQCRHRAGVAAGHRGGLPEAAEWPARSMLRVQVGSLILDKYRPAGGDVAGSATARDAKRGD